MVEFSFVDVVVVIAVIRLFGGGDDVGLFLFIYFFYSVCCIQSNPMHTIICLCLAFTTDAGRYAIKSICMNVKWILWKYSENIYGQNYGRPLANVIVTQIPQLKVKYFFLWTVVGTNTYGAKFWNFSCTSLKDKDKNAMYGRKLFLYCKPPPSLTIGVNGFDIFSFQRDYWQT